MLAIHRADCCANILLLLLSLLHVKCVQYLTQFIAHLIFIFVFFRYSFFSIISILQIILKTLVFSKLSIVSNVINLMLSARVEYIKAFRKRHTLALVAIEKKNKRPNHQWRSYSLTKPSKPSNGFCILKCDWNGNANAPRHSGFRYSDCVLRLLTTFYMHF